MNIFKRARAIAIAALLPPIVFYIGNEGIIGRLVNDIFPCVQEPMNSFPCYGVYDLFAMAFALIAGIVCLVLLAIHVYRLIRSQGTSDAKKLWILVPIIVIIANLSFAVSTFQHSPREYVSAERAIQKVQAMPEVQEWLALFSSADGTSPKTSGTPIIEIDGEQEKTYSLHAYESMPDHKATLNWYDVDKRTGAIMPLFESVGVYRYYEGTVGDQSVHLIYWPIPHETEQDAFFEGTIVFDDKGMSPLNISMRFTSGGALDGEVTDGKKTVATFTNRTEDAQWSRECDEEVRCGTWVAADNAESRFLLRPTAAFEIKDVLKP